MSLKTTKVVYEWLPVPQKKLIQSSFITDSNTTSSFQEQSYHISVKVMQRISETFEHDLEKSNSSNPFSSLNSLNGKNIIVAIEDINTSLDSRLGVGFRTRSFFNLVVRNNNLS